MEDGGIFEYSQGEDEYSVWIGNVLQLHNDYFQTSSARQYIKLAV